MAVNLTGYASVEVVCGKADPERPLAWRNIHELDSAAGIGIDAELVAQAFVNFHRGFLRASWDVLRVVVRSYAQDGEPYDPSTFLVLPVGLPGLLDVTNAEPVGLEEVLVVNRKVIGGRLGTMFLRGILTEEDFVRVNPGSERVFTSKSAYQVIANAQFAQLQTALGATVKMAMLSGTQGLLVAPLSREVTELIVTRAGNKDLRSPRKLATSQLARAGRSAGKVLGDVISGAATINEFIQAFNDIPVIPDIPLLP